MHFVTICNHKLKTLQTTMEISTVKSWVTSKFQTCPKMKRKRHSHVDARSHKPTQKSSVQCVPGCVVQKFGDYICGGWYHWKADVISFNLMPNSWLFIIWISFNQSKQIKVHPIIVVFWEPQINRVNTWCVNGIDTRFKRVGCEVMCAEPHWCWLQHAKYGTLIFSGVQKRASF